MIEKLKRIFKPAPALNLKNLVQHGAQIVDVRTKGEYALGHLPGSINIPLADLENNLIKLSARKPVIVCCASGVRSSSAKSLLKAKGFDVHNGGSWRGLQEQLH